MDGEVVAFLDVRDSDGGHASLRVSVAPEIRGRGLGSHLFETALEMLSERLQSASLRTRVHDEDTSSLQWATHRGFVQFAHRISMARPTPEHPEELAAAAARASNRSDVAIEPWAAAAFGDDWQLFAGLLSRCLSDSGDSAMGGSHVSEEQARFFAPSQRGTLIALRDGEAVGAACMSPGRGSGWHTWFTGVVPECRGEGIARALKLSSLAVARREGADRMITFNDVRNVTIIALNESLGFEIRPGIFLLEAPPSMDR
jgi:GNAT superfamily N-acetyltransferase